MDGSRVFFIHRLTDSWVSANGQREGDRQMNGLMPFSSAQFLRHATDDANGGKPQADTKPEDATGGDQKPAGKMLTQEQVDAIVADRLERERKKQEKAQADAAKAEETRRLEEQREFEKLANARKAEVDDLAAKLKTAESASAQLERATKALEAYRDAQFGKLPDEIAELLSGKDIVDQLDWLTKNGAKFVPQGAAVEADKKGGGTPRPIKGRVVATNPIEEIAAKQRQSGLYN